MSCRLSPSIFRTGRFTSRRLSHPQPPITTNPTSKPTNTTTNETKIGDQQRSNMIQLRILSRSRFSRRRKRQLPQPVTAPSHDNITPINEQRSNPTNTTPPSKHPTTTEHHDHYHHHQLSPSPQPFEINLTPSPILSPSSPSMTSPYLTSPPFSMTFFSSINYT